ncbi:beta-propeller domain-containing protein, partial [Streptosporangium fragile]|uniref:beta-propeller domain-containing protein n=1 Tax=Streptosporangium fragile TaxID=46186 RepID=UPI0031F0D248
DPHAFLYWAKTGTAVLPLTTRSDTEHAGGALVLKIDDFTITKTGTIAHPEFTFKQPRNTYSGPSSIVPDIRRSIVIGDSLWTVSDFGLKVSDMNTLADQAWIPFPETP